MAKPGALLCWHRKSVPDRAKLVKIIISPWRPYFLDSRLESVVDPTFGFIHTFDDESHTYPLSSLSQILNISHASHTCLP